jgi:hypothetical protein
LLQSIKPLCYVMRGPHRRNKLEVIFASAGADRDDIAE